MKKSVIFTTYNALLLQSGAQGETRTHTPMRAGDFESPASTIPPLGPWIA